MAGVTKVNGFVLEDQFFGREILSVAVGLLAAAPALVTDEFGVDQYVAWPELDAAVQAIETICTVSLVGVRPELATSVNMLLEGLTGNSVTDLAALTALVDAVVVGTGAVTANVL